MGIVRILRRLQSRFRLRFGLALAIVTACLVLSFHWGSLTQSTGTAIAQPEHRPITSGASETIATAPVSPPMIQLPLSTRGNRIQDATGRTVLLRGVNWFGLETAEGIPHGLWNRDYKDMLAQIKGLGYNVIRLPYSVQVLRQTQTVSAVNFAIGHNQDLEGKTPLQVMDQIIQEAQRQGLMILLDSHRLNDQKISELWYGDGFTEADWIDTWTMLADRYKNQPNVIGADLKNEPHGRASWGTGDRATDWRLAAERAGNAILAVNPHWLIIVEGVESNVPGQKLKQHWQGGNLEGVWRFPVRLKHRHKLVYSPHEYGPGVHESPWFTEKTFPNNLRDRWETGWYYIARRNIAPIYIGEFGGRQVDATSTEGIWQRSFVKFIQQKSLHFTYWSWNPNSKDTGGLLQEDWQTLELDKQQLLSPLLKGVLAIQPREPLAMVERSIESPPRSRPPVPTPLGVPTNPPPANPIPRDRTANPPTPRPVAPASPKPSASPPASVPPQRTAAAPLTATPTFQSNWQTGFCLEIRVNNPNPTPIAAWSLQFTMPQATIQNSWNGTFTNQGAQYQVAPADWARTIQPNQTVTLGFCATKLGANYQPSNFSIRFTNAG